MCKRRICCSLRASRILCLLFSCLKEIAGGIEEDKGRKAGGLGCCQGGGGEGNGAGFKRDISLFQNPGVIM